MGGWSSVHRNGEANFRACERLAGRPRSPEAWQEEMLVDFTVGA